jgi:hypothetical protein
MRVALAASSAPLELPPTMKVVAVVSTSIQIDGSGRTKD